MKNLLVALDFHENESTLIDLVRELAEPLKAKVWFIHIAAPDPDFIGNKVGPQYIRDFRAEDLRKEHRQLQEYATQFKEIGIDSEGLLIQGPTVETVLEEASKLRIDMIITGHEEHNFFYRAIYGSVSSGIMKGSKIPVLVVPY